MTIADEIIESLEESAKSSFGTYRNILKGKQKLPPKDFSSLVNLVRTDKIYDILCQDLTKKESIVLGRAIMKAHLKDNSSVIECIIRKNSQNTPQLLTCLLLKKIKIDPEPISRYLVDVISKDVVLSHLNLILVVFKYYRTCISKEVLEFCKKHKHPICKEIARQSMDVAE